MKKSKLVAVLLVVVMVFSVSPAFAEDPTLEDVAVVGGFGAVVGGIIFGTVGFVLMGPAGAWAGAEAGAMMCGGAGMVASSTGKVTAEDIKNLDVAETVMNVKDVTEAIIEIAR